MSKSRPIIFTAPMIRAILAGEKTQTRRIVKPQPPADHSPLVVDRFCPTVIDRYNEEQPGDEVFGVTTECGEWCLRCPYGQPGDTLWVRETFGMSYTDLVPAGRPFVPGGTWGSPSRPGRQPCVVFKADGPMPDDSPSETARWSPSIHMPRWASRITLEITGVRVERLQEISEADARAEGCAAKIFPGPWWQGYMDVDGALIHQQAIGETPPDWMIEPHRMADTPHLDLSACDQFRALWLSLHTPDSWAANPWVWVIAFRRVVL
jgi:hypothetical protein